VSVIQKIREKVLKGEYEFTLPHFFEEMSDDDLIFEDIERAIDKGRIKRKFT
jgi:hypothetical protein